MLSDDERREIDHELTLVPYPRAAGLEALKIVQRHRGWVSDEGLRDIAGYLHMTSEDLDAVATFYNPIFRRPVGRHVIMVCDSVSCWIMGYDKVREHLRGRLGIGMGETTPDGMFTLLPVQCLGVCDHAPAFMIGRVTHTDLTPQRLDALLDEAASDRQPGEGSGGVSGGEAGAAAPPGAARR